MIAFNLLTSGTTAGAGTFNISHTVSGSNPVLFVITTQNGSSATWNGTTVPNTTNYTPTTPPGTNCPPIKIFTLVGAQTGTFNAAITTTGAATALVVSYTGVDTSYNPLFSYSNNDTNNAAVATTTVGLTTTVNKSWLLGFVEFTGVARSMSAGAGTTLRGQDPGTISSFGLAMFDNNGPISPPALTNETFDMVAGSEFLTMILYELPAVSFDGSGQMIIL